MHIGTIDAAATQGDSWIHRASPVAKLLAFALMLAAAMVSWNLLVIGALVVMLVALVLSARVSLKLAFSLAAYPALFAAVFALSSAPDLMVGTVIVLKAACAGLAAVSVALTTPYPQIFAPIQRVTPPLVGDALLMTYRSTFLLLDKFASLLTAVRLRSGLGRRQPLRAARATTAALGGLLLYSIDLAQRDYDVMRLRGYDSRLRIGLPKPASVPRDALLIALALTALLTSVLWRIAAPVLNPYSWVVMFPAVALIALSAYVRRAK
ncbi:MAG: CbiQ family ECF transporter T component [Coriobacteriia bacterium]